MHQIVVTWILVWVSSLKQEYLCVGACCAGGTQHLSLLCHSCSQLQECRGDILNSAGEAGLSLPAAFPLYSPRGRGRGPARWAGFPACISSHSVSGRRNWYPLEVMSPTDAPRVSSQVGRVLPGHWQKRHLSYFGVASVSGLILNGKGCQLVTRPFYCPLTVTSLKVFWPFSVL